MITSSKHESEVIYMTTFLDLLVIVFIVLVTVSLLCICLMFLTRNLKIKKISYYILSILCIYAGYIGIRIGDGLFLTQTIIAITSFKEDTKMVNKNNKVVCGAHGVASYFMDINKKYTTLQVPIVGSNPTRSAIY